MRIRIRDPGIKRKSSRKTMPTKHPPINGVRSEGTARVYTTLNVFSSRCIDEH